MKLLSITFLSLLLAFSANAGVNLKNGNFYISYTDINVPGGGQDLEIRRTYNSKSAHKGWFGFGWGSDYETYLRVSADGSVIVYENGAGAKTRFTPKTAIDAESAAKKIVDAMRKKSPLSNTVADELIEKLKKDAELRQAYAKKFNVQSNLAAGTVLYTNQRGLQEVHVLKDGYKRIFNSGKTETYDKEGRITKVQDKNGYYIDFEYSKEGTLQSLKDSQAKQLFFAWYSDGKVKNIWKAGNKKTEYKFDGDNLVESKDVGDNVFKYTYDNFHNLTAVTYSDGSKMTIGYEPKTQFTSSVQKRDGETTEYEYGANPKNPDFHYWTVVKKKLPSGKESKNRYEYEIKTKQDGSHYTYRIVTEVNGLKTETVYSECCSLPLKITRGKDVTTFEYNKKGLLTKKTSTRGEYVELSYHEELNKITKVVNNDGWTSYEYDKKGNLQKAKNNKGKSILLVYDRRGRITKMVDYDQSSKEKNTLSFQYNALGKPVEIEMSNVGKISVAYDNYGEIKKVESKAGHKMALKVTQSFQSLLSIVKPAGVNLNL